MYCVERSHRLNQEEEICLQCPGFIQLGVGLTRSLGYRISTGSGVAQGWAPLVSPLEEQNNLGARMERRQAAKAVTSVRENLLLSGLWSVPEGEQVPATYS